MKLAFSTLGCPDWNWDMIVATAKDMGFQGIEVRGVGNELYAPDIPAFSGDRIAGVRESLLKKDLSIVCLTSACYLDDQRRAEQVVREGYAYIDLAQKLGIPYVRVLGDRAPQPGAPVEDAFVAAQLGKLAEYAMPRGVCLLIETNGAYADSARLASLVSGFRRDAVGVLWDVHHPYRYFGESPEETYRNIGAFVRYLHVKDSVCDEQGKLQYKMMGYGDVPVSAALRVLKENDYSGFVSLEWVKRWYADLEAPGVAFMQFVHYMNRQK